MPATHLRYPKKSWFGAALRRSLLAGDGVVITDDLGEVGEQAGVRSGGR